AMGTPPDDTNTLRLLSQFSGTKWWMVPGHGVTSGRCLGRSGITNLNSEESALRALMTRTGSIPNILQVQNELFTVEGEIETLTADEGSLISRATYATLSVDIAALPSGKRAAKKAPVNAVIRAVHLAGHNTLAVLHDVALAIGWAFPLIVAALLLLGIWQARRIWRRRAAPTAPTTTS
ncbi:MAG: DUF4349 domain-containing protein, partial [Acidimicrobiales bacterium]